MGVSQSASSKEAARSACCGGGGTMDDQAPGTRQDPFIKGRLETVDDQAAGTRQDPFIKGRLETMEMDDQAPGTRQDPFIKGRLETVDDQAAGTRQDPSSSKGVSAAEATALCTTVKKNGLGETGDPVFSNMIAFASEDEGLPAFEVEISNRLSAEIYRVHVPATEVHTAQRKNETQRIVIPVESLKRAIILAHRTRTAEAGATSSQQKGSAPSWRHVALFAEEEGGLDLQEPASTLSSTLTTNSNGEEDVEIDETKTRPLLFCLEDSRSSVAGLARSSTRARKILTFFLRDHVVRKFIEFEASKDSAEFISKGDPKNRLDIYQEPDEGVNSMVWFLYSLAFRVYGFKNSLFVNRSHKVEVLPGYFQKGMRLEALDELFDSHGRAKWVRAICELKTMTPQEEADCRETARDVASCLTMEEVAQLFKASNGSSELSFTVEILEEESPVEGAQAEHVWGRIGPGCCDFPKLAPLRYCRKFFSTDVWRALPCNRPDFSWTAESTKPPAFIGDGGGIFGGFLNNRELWPGRETKDLYRGNVLCNFIFEHAPASIIIQLLRVGSPEDVESEQSAADGPAGDMILPPVIPEVAINAKRSFHYLFSRNRNSRGGDGAVVMRCLLRHPNFNGNLFSSLPQLFATWIRELSDAVLLEILRGAPLSSSHLNRSVFRSDVEKNENVVTYALRKRSETVCMELLGRRSLLKLWKFRHDMGELSPLAVAAPTYLDLAQKHQSRAVVERLLECMKEQPQAVEEFRKAGKNIFEEDFLDKSMCAFEEKGD
ncbi:unnamed protein product [Amoebophrya sp. A25]|nr:unnamed protein product [Amoebophrya sp. A25]|eukprot:GSA25T00001321001.1